METEIVLRNDSLWKRLQGFSLDSPDADFPFSRKLAKEENWTIDFTRKAIEEYKKFIYLCCVLPNGASPSEMIDKVWHMHLIYTQNYWEEFCPNILRRKLHHYPSKGGRNEKEKHKNWFQDTLKNYEKIFNQKAPEDIWLNKDEKANRRKGWWKQAGILTVLLCCFILNSCSDGADNLFSLIVIALVIFGIISFISGIFNKNKNDKGKGDSGSSGSCGGSSSCSSSCGSSCGGGCGGCGGCGGS